MATIVTRAGKGSPLTTAELDANFTNLNNDKIEADSVDTLTNKTIDGANNTLSVRLANDVSGTLPVANGGTGAVTLTGVLKGNGTSAFTAGNVNLASEVTGTLPVANGGTGITSFGTGVATWLGTPTSANLAAAITDETGTGALVFANSPTLVTPALGTPVSGVVTNLTGTASININGTVGATTPTTGAFTTLSASTSLTTPLVTNAGALALSATGANIITASTNGVERMRVDSAGNVGIGTSGPITKLNVSGGSSAVYQTFTDTSSNFQHAYVGKTGNNLTFGFSAANASFSADERMRITSAGNVGIGTSSPGEKLVVAGNIQGTTFSSGLSGTTSSISSGSSETIIGSVNNYSLYIVYAGGTSNTSAQGVALAQTNGAGDTIVTQLSGGATGCTIQASGNNIQIKNDTATQAYRWKAFRLINLG